MMVTNRIEQNKVNVTSFDDPQHQETTRKREKKALLSLLVFIMAILKLVLGRIKTVGR